MVHPTVTSGAGRRNMNEKSRLDFRLHLRWPGVCCIARLGHRFSSKPGPVPSQVARLVDLALGLSRGREAVDFCLEDCDRGQELVELNTSGEVIHLGGQLVELNSSREKIHLVREGGKRRIYRSKRVDVIRSEMIDYSRVVDIGNGKGDVGHVQNLDQARFPIASWLLVGTVSLIRRTELWEVCIIEIRDLL